MRDASRAKNTIVVGNRAHIVTTGDSSEGLRTGQSGSLIRLGDDATIETSGASSTGFTQHPPPEPSLATTLLLR